MSWLLHYVAMPSVYLTILALALMPVALLVVLVVKNIIFRNSLPGGKGYMLDDFIAHNLISWRGLVYFLGMHVFLIALGPMWAFWTSVGVYVGLIALFILVSIIFSPDVG